LVRFGLFGEVEELLVNHRERLDGDVGEFECGKGQMKLPLAVKSVARKRARDALDLILTGRICTAKLQWENAAIEKAVELFTNGPQTGQCGGAAKYGAGFNFPLLQSARREKAAILQIVEIDVFTNEREDDALDVITPELVSKLFSKLLEIFQQAPIGAFVGLNIATALAPELSGINCLRAKFCKPVGNFIEPNQVFEDALAFAAICIIALEPGIKPQASVRANKEEGNDILIPDERVNFVRCCHVISFADVSHWNRRTFIVERTQRIHPFKPASPPPRSRAEDMPNIRRPIKRRGSSLEEISRGAVTECVEKLWQLHWNSAPD